MPPHISRQCQFYFANSCTKGDRCLFSHEKPRMVCIHYKSGSCTFGERCRNTHNEPGAKSTHGKQHCVFWKNGSCSKGDQCRFLHESLLLSSNSTSWRAHTTLPTPSGATAPKPMPCVFWESGRCLKGDQCLFLHESPSSSTLQLSKHISGSRPMDRSMTTKGQETLDRQSNAQHSEYGDGRTQPLCHKIQIQSKTIEDDTLSPAVVSSKDQIERSFLASTRALIGSGAAIEKVITAFESCRVTISNIPDEASHREIMTMAEGFGALKSVILGSSAVVGTIRKAELEYLDPDCAKTAAMGFDGAELHRRNLTAQLDLRSTETGTADLRSSTLKLSWFAPSRLAFAHYESISEAQTKASQLDGRVFMSREVSTVFQKPSPSQRDSFTVIVKNLSLHMSPDALKMFCGTKSVQIGQASYHGKDGTKRVHELLSTFGPVESFDHSHPTPNDLKVKVLARFAKPEHAASAAAQLQGQSQSFLGGAKIWLTLLHSVKYNVPKAQFRVLKDELHGLQAGVAQNAKVRMYDRDESGCPVDPVCIRIYGDNPKSLGQFKTRLEGILSGEEVKHGDGTTSWDRFFLAKESQIFIEQVQRESGAFVRRDTRRKRLQMSGSRQQKNCAQKLLLLKIEELRAQRHRLSLTKSELGRLLQGGLARLQGILGEDKLFLDVRSRSLIVRGSQEDIQVMRLSLKADEADVTSPATQNAADCPVCFCEVTNPVKLTCGHSYCLACLRHYLASADSFPLKCLANDGRCDFAVPLATIHDILPPVDETKLFETAFLAHIHRHPNEFHYCPSSDCQQIYRPAEPAVVLRCPSCLARICPSCHVEFHEGLTCAEHRDNQSGGDVAFQRWKEANNVQACPNCKAEIEKSMGCNHVVCIRCQTHMCFVCLATFPHGAGIYEHMSIAHGGLGL